ncbi:MAG: glycine--tRNA ligase subunit beta [Rhodospirillaceae bacterium]|nr:glycine--tRNA ligase subunit beta [Rhodospirillaceae bacterium]
MAEFLLELFCEEIPARMQARAADDLLELFSGALTAAGLDFAAARSFVTPRRLALVVDGLPDVQPDSREERKGPRADAPPAAIDGFLRSTGLTLDQCEQRDTPKGPVWFAVIEKPGLPTDEVLVDLIHAQIPKLAWPKTMRWGEGAFRWVRPLHHVLAVFDGKPLLGVLEPEPHTRLTFSAMAHGHRFLAPEAFPVHSFTEYELRLRDAFVVLDREERKRIIREGAAALAEPMGLRLIHDPGLEDEVAGLVEWPVPLIGRIDAQFMDVPAEVLTTAMRTHQRYFSLRHADGALAPHFVVVANTKARHDGREVIAGNERVLRARLSDAKFFWDNDRKVPLVDRLPKLEEIVFHAKLGSMLAKSERIARLAALLAGEIPEADGEAAAHAGRLAKADLASGMVGEFPELQGTMGRYYARHGGVSELVADAIGSHYAPQGPSDTCPTAPTAIAVALADKIDTLVGFFAVGERPTGSRDPYALRRAALGVIRLLVENAVRLDLRRVLIAAGDGYGSAIVADPATLADEVIGFLADRLKISLRDRGVRHDLIDAVFAVGGEYDLVRLLDRVAALASFLDTDDGANLLTAHRRAANIVRIESKKDGRAYDGHASADLLDHPAEIALNGSLQAARPAVAEALAAEDFAQAMTALASLRRPVDDFFDTVTVNAEAPELRANRLALLATITAIMNLVAEFARVEG